MTVKFRGVEYVSLGFGWFVRELERGGVRLYRGTVQPGTNHPISMSTFSDGGEFVTFESVDEAREWLEEATRGV